MSDRCENQVYPSHKKSRPGFTLIELLVVVLVVSVLLSILLPSFRKARQQARKVVCISNLRAVGTAIGAYAVDHNDMIPFGPEPGSFFYPVKGNVTSLISLTNGKPVGLGLMLDNALSDQPKVLFCPGADQPSKAEEQLARVGYWEAQGDYYYRHASVSLLSGTPDLSHVRLSNLGKNRNGHQINALAMDVQFLAHPSLEIWGVQTRTSHQKKITNVLFADGQVVTHDNTVIPPDDPGYVPDVTEESFVIDVGISPYDALDKILTVFEKADRLK